MGFWIRVFIIVGIIASFIFGAAYLFTVFDGKAAVIQQLEHLTRREVTIDKFYLSFPFDFNFKNLNIEGMGRADYIFISPSILGFFTGSIAFNKVEFIRPKVQYEYNPPPAAAQPQETEMRAAIRAAEMIYLIVNHPVAADHAHTASTWMS